MPHLRTLSQCPVFNKRVFLRADLNVPFSSGGVIEDDFRLKALIPTIEYLFEQESTIILGSHLGRPMTQDLQFSTRHLVPWFLNMGYAVSFAQSPEEAEQLSHSIEPGTILMLENLRFFLGETGGTDAEREAFARHLAVLADVYVNDAFGTIHRSDTSIALLPSKFLPQYRCVGLTVEREIANLSYLTDKPEKPFIVVLGGAKLEDKLPLLKNFLAAPIMRRPDAILIGGALAFPFLQAMQRVTNPARPELVEGSYRAGQSGALIDQANAIIALAKKNNVQLVFPEDFLCIDGPIGSVTTRVTSWTLLDPGSTIVDIGPDSCKIFAAHIRDGATVFANGTMGIYENPAYRKGTETILKTIADIKATTIVGGGDCVAALHQAGLESKISFISTGGGAALAFLGASDPYAQLPGLAALVKR